MNLDSLVLVYTDKLIVFLCFLFGLHVTQTHLICTVPPYAEPDIIEPVTVQMLVTSSNKYSEPHNFVYTPKSAFGAGALAMASTLASLQHAHTKSIQGILSILLSNKTKEKKDTPQIKTSAK